MQKELKNKRKLLTGSAGCYNSIDTGVARGGGGGRGLRLLFTVPGVDDNGSGDTEAAPPEGEPLDCSKCMDLMGRRVGGSMELVVVAMGRIARGGATEGGVCCGANEDASPAVAGALER